MKPVALLASVAVTVKLLVPLLPGVPLRAPVEVFRLSPIGRLPAVMA